MSIETQLALASKTRVERRDPQSNYHKMDAARASHADARFFLGELLPRDRISRTFMA